MPFLLVVLSLLNPSPSVMGRGVHPAAWGRGSWELTDSPAGLSRLEYPELASWWWSSSGDTPEISVSGGLPLPGDRYFIGGTLTSDSDLGGFRAVLGGARVLTGDPIGFMEGLFGPSMVIGLSGGVSDHGDGAQTFASGSAQLSLFPSFALGAVSTWRRDHRPDFTLGFTHVFNRAFTLNAAMSRGTPQIGGVLKVSPRLSVTAGTMGDGWHSGLVLEEKAFRADLAVVLDENRVSAGAGLGWRIGW